MTAPRRVLILSASSGAGHVRAAQALEKTFAAAGGCAVEHLDALDYTSKFFQKIYDDAYITLVRRAPGIMGLVCERFDRPWRHRRRMLALDRLNIAQLLGDSERLGRMRAAARTMTRPAAAREIAADALRLVESS